jgi:hypothetical protein
MKAGSRVGLYEGAELGVGLTGVADGRGVPIEGRAVGLTGATDGGGEGCAVGLPMQRVRNDMIGIVIGRMLYRSRL